MFGKQGIMLIEEMAEAAGQVLAAFKTAGISNPLTSFASVSESISYLETNAASKDRLTHPLPCFIILSIGTGDNQGLEFLKWLRNHPKLKRMPVVCFARENDPALIASAYDSGCNSVLIKPIAPEELLRVVKSINGYWVILVEKPML